MDGVDRDEEDYDDADMDYGNGKGDGTSLTSWISTLNPYSSTAEPWSRPQEVGSIPIVGNKKTSITETFPKTFLRLVFLCLDVHICIFLYPRQRDGTVYRFEDAVNQFVQFSWTILYSKKQIGKQYHWRCLMIFCICFYVFYAEYGWTIFLNVKSTVRAVNTENKLGGFFYGKGYRKKYRLDETVHSDGSLVYPKRTRDLIDRRVSFLFAILVMLLLWYHSQTTN